MDYDLLWLTKLIWQAITPDMILLYLVFAALVCALRGYMRAAKSILGLIVFLLLVVTLFPVDEWIMVPLENIFPHNPRLPLKVDGIIVLAGPEESGPAARYLAFQALARRYPGARLVSTNRGGNELTEHGSERLVRNLSIQAGFDVSRILFETNARNTVENAVLSKALVQPLPDEKWILVTSAYHMPRAIGVFCKAGWPVIPYPVERLTRTGSLFRVDPDAARHSVNLTMGIREWLGLVWYYATGKTNTLLPRGCV